MTEEQSDVHSDNGISDSSTVLLGEESDGSARFRADKGLRVAVIGAGPAGLCAARHLLHQSEDDPPPQSSPGSPRLVPTVFERSPDVGGTWAYSETTGKDKYGLPIHSSLYKDLRTNLPKECMSFPDFPYKDGSDRSYISWDVVLQYLREYADFYMLRPHIKFNHHVKRIAPVGKGWGLTAEDLPNKTESVYYFDAVMICSGPNNIPVYPQLEGMAKFSGLQMHSREFRTVDGFKDKNVLIIGLGPSGMDISLLLCKVANQIFLSHNKPRQNSAPFSFPDKVVLKPNVESLNDREVLFTDGSVERVDVIIYCTGYTHNYPFLTPDCGIVVDQYVSPLYKHLVNIDHPTMCIVGLPKHCPHVIMVDYQVRFFLNTLRGVATLPSRQEMMADLEADIETRKGEKQRKKDYHKLWRDRTVRYFDQLSEIGRLKPVAPVHLKMFSNAFLRALKDFQNFREAKYTIVDDENFTMIENYTGEPEKEPAEAAPETKQ